MNEPPANARRWQSDIDDVWTTPITTRYAKCSVWLQILQRLILHEIAEHWRIAIEWAPPRQLNGTWAHLKNFQRRWSVGTFLNGQEDDELSPPIRILCNATINARIMTIWTGNGQLWVDALIRFHFRNAKTEIIQVNAAVVMGPRNRDGLIAFRLTVETNGVIASWWYIACRLFEPGGF